MRYIFLIFLLLSTNIVIADEVYMFEPLSPNQRLAYGLHYDDYNAIHIMNLYVLCENNLQNKILIGTWSNILLGYGVQFSNNNNMCFFAISKPIDEYNFSLDIFYANGYTGEVRLLTNIPNGPFRVSNDGRFLIYIYPFTNFFTANIYIYDIVENLVINKLEWSTNFRVDAGWAIIRTEDVFKIYGLQGSSIVALAVLNAQIPELTVEWDMTNINVEFLPDITDVKWQDDIVLYEINPYSRLY